MLLAIDVGNTNMVFGLYDGDKLRGSFRISTNSERTSDELGMLIAQYYHFHDIACADTTAVVIASVVPPVMYTLINAIRKYLFVQPVIAGRDADIGIAGGKDCAVLFEHGEKIRTLKGDIVSQFVEEIHKL